MGVKPVDEHENARQQSRSKISASTIAPRPPANPKYGDADSSEPAGDASRPALSDAQNPADLYRLLVESVQDYAIFMLDSQGQVVSWNEGARQIKGYESHEIIGRHFSCFYAPEDIATGKPQRELEFAAVNGRYTEEGRRLRKDGSSFWASVVITALYDQRRQLRGYAKVTRDITSSKQAEEKSRLMVRLALNAMVLVDERGNILLVNPQAETLFNYTSEQLVGQPVELLVPDRFKVEHPANRGRYFLNPIVRPMGAGRDLYGRRSDGSEFPVEIGLHPIETESGLKVLGSIVDITERKRAEEQAHKYLTELAHVARLSTIGQMVSELAHEMNQPLAAAANYARACVSFARTEKGATLEQLVGWMDKAAAQIERTLGIVNRMAAFVKNEPATRTLVNVNRVIENIVALSVLGVSNSSRSGPKICPLLKLDESLPSALADRIQIEQVLLNLIRNGVEAMQDVSAGDAQLVIRTSADGEFLRIDVSDSGQGIPPEQMSRLFGPFFTTKPNGMGLGLSISRSIVENHRGQMSVVSNLGQGTTFSFTLPVSQERDVQ